MRGEEKLYISAEDRLTSAPAAVQVYLLWPAAGGGHASSSTPLHLLYLLEL